ncbi:MAG TPA: hypothetical protein VFF33_00195 [Ignavibacteriaceae bacterium]|nr:hypothetical protein [Ignavibacteriaceae bacterium]
MKKRNLITQILAVVLLLIFSMSLALAKEGDGKGKRMNKPNDKAGDAYRMFINNIDLPMNRSGVMADVLIDGRDGGRLDGKVFLFSGGFFLSGKNGDGNWANAVASASRIQDYNPGTWATGQNDSRAQMYVVAQKDGDFAKSWIDWKDAVALGAEFYDGDGDGVYNPIDANGNGKWDKTEDRPDLIGDETVWCVYFDNVDPALRRFNSVDPQGIEIRQTVFAFATKSAVGNMIFVRYQIVNTGSVADVLDSVYFGVWADPDLGDPYDDLVGSDTRQDYSGYNKPDNPEGLNSGFVYNDGPDDDFGSKPPCFLIDFFQGPVSYIPGETFTDANGNGVYDEGVDTPLDTAYNIRGQIRGVESFPGAKNLGMSSFVHYQQSDVQLGDPNTNVEARNYMLGLARLGEQLDPCTWRLGTVTPANICTQINNKFWYSGDPVQQIGWLNSVATDQRQMSNTGPFKLEKGKPVTIVAAYVVGRGQDALTSITEAKKNDQIAQIIFDNNFPSPPPPPPVQITTETGENFIDLNWNTSQQFTYNAQDTVLGVNKTVGGFYVTQYLSNVKLNTVEGVENSKIIAYYDLADSINNVYVRVANGGQDLAIPVSPLENQLDSVLYADPQTGRIKLRVSQDAFTGGQLVKGKDYYFTVTQWTMNHNAIYNRSVYNSTGQLVYDRSFADDYIDLGGGVEEIETPIVIVTMGKDIYSPNTTANVTNHNTGAASGDVNFLVVDKAQLTGNNYQVEFFKDTQAPVTQLYTPFWRLRNLTTGTVLIDSSKNYDFDTTKFAGKAVEGILVKVKPIVPAIGNAVNSFTWSDNPSALNGLGVFYVGQDMPQGRPHPVFGSTNLIRSSAITSDKLRKVEIRFAPNSGKAYRYINGVKGTVLSRRNTYVYGGAITSTEGTPLGVQKIGEGFVDVPFTAWVVDSAYGETRQLAVGFIERANNMFGGKPDGEWDPGDSVLASGEVIIVFDSDYDPTGQQLEYTGVGLDATVQNTVDINKGWTIPATAGATAEQVTTAKSPWFDAMYVVGVQKKGGDPTFWSEGDKITIPVTAYPYTDKDTYTATTLAGGALTDAQKKALFDKVNVFPNPLFAYNPATSYNSGNPDEPFVTFTNLPEQVTVRIFTLSGTLVRTLTTADKSSLTSPFLQWNLLNEDNLRVASGMFLAIVDSPNFGQKVLKFAIIQPQKQIQRF